MGFRRMVFRRSFYITITVAITLSTFACGKKQDKTDDPAGTGMGDAYPTDPAEAIVVGEKKSVKDVSVKSMPLWGQWSHGVVKRYSFPIAIPGHYKLDTYFSTTCVGINKAAGKMGDVIYSLRDGNNPSTIIASSRVGDPLQVPSYEIPGKLVAANYIVDIMWVATSDNCSVSGDFTLLADDSSMAKDHDKFPSVRLALGTPYTYSANLVEDGGSGLWVPFDIKQSFRFVLTQPGAVTIAITGYESNCKDSGYMSQYSVYDFQRYKSLKSGDLTVGDKLLELGSLDMGLYEVSVIKGADEACRIAMQVKADRT